VTSTRVDARWLTLEHVLALAVEDAGARLQVLALEELGEGDGLGVRRAGLDGLVPTLLVAVVVPVVVMVVIVVVVAAGAVLVAALLLGLHHARALLLHGLLLDVLDELGHRHACLLRILGDAALDLGDLLGRRPLHAGRHLARRGEQLGLFLL